MDAQLDRILAEDYLADLPARSVAQLRELRDECKAVETQLSYLRRLVQGHHDIVANEIERRGSGDAPSDVGGLVDRLPAILADRSRAPGAGRLPSGLEPGELSGRLVERLEGITRSGPMRALDRATDDELATAEAELQSLEQELSRLRRTLFDRIDPLQAELTRRYRDGEARVDDLLSGS